MNPIIKTSNLGGEYIDNLMVEYGPEAEKAHGINFDFSYVFMYGRLDTWYMNTLTGIENFKKLACRVHEFENKTSDYVQIAKDVLIENNMKFE